MKYRNCVTWTARLAVLAGAVLWSGWYAAAADVVEPFNGKDLSGWKFRGNADQSKWVVGTAKLKEGKPAELEVTPGGQEMINAARSLDIFTEAKFGDCLIELEVMVPEGSNSGIYLMGNYEIQVLDSFGKKEVDAGDMAPSTPTLRRS